MKKKIIKHGSQRITAYMKPAGKGYEVGLMHGAKNLFMGNFINIKEAQNWYAMMNREFSRFSKKYWPNAEKPSAFHYKFITNAMYKKYYDYLDVCFGKYTKSFHREWNKDLKKYNQMKKAWGHKETFFARRSA